MSGTTEVDLLVNYKVTHLTASSGPGWRVMMSSRGQVQGVEQSYFRPLNSQDLVKRHLISGPSP